MLVGFAVFAYAGTKYTNSTESSGSLVPVNSGSDGLAKIITVGGGMVFYTIATVFITFLVLGTIEQNKMIKNFEAQGLASEFWR